MARARRHNGGFTLIEIMVAIAILGTAVVMLLDAHYASLRLFDQTRQEIVFSGFLESAIGAAEMDLQSGVTSGSGDFGKRHEGYTYSFSATPAGGSDNSSMLYEMSVTVTAPDKESRTLKMLAYRMGQST